MANRLEPIVLDDYTGGLNLRANQFQLGDNESPELANIIIDPLGGISTRKGWERWNDADIPVDPEEWDPRRAYLTQLSDGTDIVYIAANDTVWHTDSGSTEFIDSECVATASTHLADFASFGDTTYIATGILNNTCRRVGTGTMATVPALSTGNFNDDYLNPLHNVFPKCEVVEAHAGYMFAAHTSEAGTEYPNRVRWSHPTSQDDWAQNDYIDIETGGSEIVALMSYEDHLLIFKRDSIWALYGYNLESWQLIQKSATVGAVGPQAVTRNERALAFYSASDQGGIYRYDGERFDEVSIQLRRAFTEIMLPELVWVGWMGRKLWVTMPWNYSGATDDNSGAFIFDPTVGEGGAWTFFTSTVGSIGPIVGGSNIDSQIRPMGVLRNGDHPCVVRVDALNNAADLVDESAVLGAAMTTDPWSMPAIITDDGFEIVASGSPGLAPFPTYYRTPWLTAQWPTRKKSWRRPDFVCRRTERDHKLQITSYRDYEELNARRSSIIEVFTGGGTVWGHFIWRKTEAPAGPVSLWGDGAVAGATIRRGSSFGLCRALQLRVSSLTPGAQWGIDAIVTKYVMRRFH